MKTETRRILVETEDGLRYFRVPSSALLDTKFVSSDQLATGIYVTDSYCSPRGRVIERRYSCWADRGKARGLFYFLVEDEDDLRRRYDGWGLRDHPEMV